MITKSYLWGINAYDVYQGLSISIFSIIIRRLTLDIDKTDSDHFSLIRIPTPACPKSSAFQKNLSWQFFPIIFQADSPF